MRSVSLLFIAFFCLGASARGQGKSTDLGLPGVGNLSGTNWQVTSATAPGRPTVTLNDGQWEWNVTEVRTTKANGALVEFRDGEVTIRYPVDQSRRLSSNTDRQVRLRITHQATKGRSLLITVEGEYRLNGRPLPVFAKIRLTENADGTIGFVHDMMDKRMPNSPYPEADNASPGGEYALRRQ